MRGEPRRKGDPPCPPCPPEVKPDVDEEDIVPEFNPIDEDIIETILASDPPSVDPPPDEVLPGVPLVPPPDEVPSGLPPAPPPDEAPPPPRPHHVRRPPRVGFGWHYVEIERLAYVVYDDNGLHLNAHCSSHLERKCHMDRLAYPNESRGREGQRGPLGLLMAWLMAGENCDRKEHGDLKKALEARAGFEERKYAR